MNNAGNTMRTNIQIERLRPEYINGAVDAHLEAFPDFFLTFLGKRFLAEFYAAFLNDSEALAFVAVDEDGTVCGIVAGTRSPDLFFRRLLMRRWWAFVIASVGAVARRPTAIRRLFRALLYRGGGVGLPGRALLSSIAVRPAARRQKIGQKLLLYWCDALRFYGVCGCYLITDAVDNDGVNRFYEQNGWAVDCCYRSPEGRLMNRLILNLDDRPKDSSIGLP